MIPYRGRRRGRRRRRPRRGSRQVPRRTNSDIYGIGWVRGWWARYDPRSMTWQIQAFVEWDATDPADLVADPPRTDLSWVPLEALSDPEEAELCLDLAKFKQRVLVEGEALLSAQHPVVLRPIEAALEYHRDFPRRWQIEIVRNEFLEEEEQVSSEEEEMKDNESESESENESESEEEMNVGE